MALSGRLLATRNLVFLVLSLTAAISPTRAQWECTWEKVGAGCGGCYGFSQAYWRQYSYPQCVPCSAFCIGGLSSPANPAVTSGADQLSRPTAPAPSCSDDPTAIAATRALAANHWFFNIAVPQSVIAELAAINAPAASTLLAFSRMRNFPGDKRHGTVSYGSLPTLASVTMELQDPNSDVAKAAEQLPAGHGGAVTYSSRRLTNGAVRVELRTTVVTDGGSVIREVGGPVWVDAVARGIENVELRHLGTRTFENLEVVRWGQAN